MLSLKSFCFLIIGLFITTTGIAQTTIKGIVLDGNTKTPIPFATVFLNSTSIGTRTHDDGSFTLSNVTNGKYTVVISSIGYATMKQDVFVKGETIDLKRILLEPTARQLSEVKIKPRKELPPSKRKHYLNMFLKEFLGQTENAEQCKLTNPEILDFDFDPADEKFRVSAPDFLIVENNALGYKIKYLLQSFLLDNRNYYLQYTGYSIYEDLPGTPTQKEKWKQARTKAYLGSQMHFFRSCITNQVTQNEFTVFKVTRVPTGRPTDSLIKVKVAKFALSNQQDSIRYWNFQQRLPAFNQQIGVTPLKAVEFIKLTNIKGVYAFTYPSNLLINFRNKKNKPNAYSTLVTFLQEEVYFDSNGIITSPLALKNENYWGRLRLADALPFNYETAPFIEEI